LKFLNCKNLGVYIFNYLNNNMVEQHTPR